MSGGHSLFPRILRPAVTSWPAGTGMPTYREVYLEKDEPPAQPTLEDLLRPETEEGDEEALSLADFEDEQ